MLIPGLMAMAADIPSKETQIAGAVLAAPAELRDGAAVLGFDAEGKRVMLREGKNELICLAADPAKSTFEVDCYHKDLEPFMARGRELLAQKITGAKRNEIRFRKSKTARLRCHGSRDRCMFSPARSSIPPAGRSKTLTSAG
jgi:hypothetical protein